MAAEHRAVPPALERSEAIAGEPRAWSRVRVRELPIGVALAFIVAASSAIRLALAASVPGPGVLPDEVVYSEFAKSLGASGHFLIRDVPFAGWSYGPLYVLLIAPAYFIDSLPHAFLAAKAIGAVVMSLSAVPVYLLARRLLDRRAALLAATLTLLLPSLAYASRVMTESLFLPLFLTTILSFVACVEQPTRKRQLAVLGVLALALLTRSQALVLLPAFVTAAALEAWLELRSKGEMGLRPLARRLARYNIVWLVFAGAAAGAVVIGVARRSSPIPLGSLHNGIFDHLELLDMPKWILFHLAQLDLAVGVIPFAAFLLFAGNTLRDHADRPTRVFGVVSLSVAGWFLAAIGLYATQTPYDRVNERYLFYVEPLILIAFLAWLEPPRRRWTPAVLAAAVLPLALPYRSLLNYHVYAATPGLIPWLDIRTLGGTIAVVGAVAAVCACAALLLLRRPRKDQIVVPVVAYLAVSAFLTQAAFSGVSRDVVKSAVGGTTDRAWIDDAVGDRADVVAVWTKRDQWWLARRLIWVNEFFNRSVGRVYYLYDPETYDLPQTRVHVRGSALITPDGRPLRADYVLSDGPVIAGARIASRPSVGLTLYRVDGLVHVLAMKDGRRHT